MIAAVLCGYVVLVLLVGVIANRWGGDATGSPEDYFLAGRGLGAVVLFMALFGTNATAFVLVGIPGKTYHGGIATFGLNAPVVALGVPLTFWLVGAPARAMARRLGALTPAEIFAERFEAPAVGYVLAFFFTLYTVPYMVTAVMGAAVTLQGVTEGAVPEAVGGLGVVIVAVVYTLVGGMRATAWTNVLQGSLFLGFMVAAFFVLSSSLGGLEAATASVAAIRPELLVRGAGKLFTPKGWSSWALTITLTVIAFPHMLVRLMAGRSEAALRSVARVYPVALLLLWVPAVMIGFWGAAAYPGLEGRASDRIFSLMAAGHMPPFLAAIGFVAVVAAVMSTLDAQLLTLSSMLVRDVLRRVNPTRKWDEVRTGRGFCVGVAVCVYALAQVWGSSVFEIAALAFSGYVTLFPTLVLGVRWRRFTAPAAIASIVTGNAVLGLGVAGWLPTFGFLPIFWALLVGFAVAVGVSLATAEASQRATDRAFGVSPPAPAMD